MGEFWQAFLSWLASAGAGTGSFLAWMGIGLLCLAGLVLSALSITGAWLIACAALGAGFLRSGPEAFPGPLTIGLFFVLAAGVDVTEWVASSLGVRRRGGGKAAGCMAFIGSVLGMILGSCFLPIPFFGGVVGAALGAFALVYAVERMRSADADSQGRSLHVAAGALWATVAILILKNTVAAALILWLIVGLCACV